MTEQAKNYGFPGFLRPSEDTNDSAASLFAIEQRLAKISTVTLAKVVSVTNSGDLSPVGFVDVQPLVNQVDGSGNSFPQAIVNNVPYFRLQGGANAIIIDPQVGDIGMIGFSDRDLTAVKANRAQSNPGSYRRFSSSDGLYLGGMLNGVPNQIVQFNSNGITITSPTKITLTAPEVSIEAENKVSMDTPLVEMTGQMIQTGAKGSGATTYGGLTNTGGTISSNGIVLETHKHGGVETGGGQTGGPV